MDSVPTRVAAAAATESTLEALRALEHGGCFACRPVEQGGLGLRFHLLGNGEVQSEWDCPSAFQGYGGILHGGVLATALDSAMVHVLFAYGLSARTGELVVRYRAPVRVGPRIVVRGILDEACPPLFHLRAELRQEGVLCAHARGKFMLSPQDRATADHTFPEDSP